jgi:hypothetical protein
MGGDCRLWRLQGGHGLGPPSETELPRLFANPGWLLSRALLGWLLNASQAFDGLHYGAAPGEFSGAGEDNDNRAKAGNR